MHFLELHHVSIFQGGAFYLMSSLYLNSVTALKCRCAIGTLKITKLTTFVKGASELYTVIKTLSLKSCWIKIVLS